MRIKVLTEAGKEYANVDCKSYSSDGDGGYTVGDDRGQDHPSRWHHHSVYRQAIREAGREGPGLSRRWQRYSRCPMSKSAASSSTATSCATTTTTSSRRTGTCSRTLHAQGALPVAADQRDAGLARMRQGEQLTTRSPGPRFCRRARIQAEPASRAPTDRASRHRVQYPGCSARSRRRVHAADREPELSRAVLLLALSHEGRVLEEPGQGLGEDERQVHRAGPKVKAAVKRTGRRLRHPGSEAAKDLRGCNEAGQHLVRPRTLRRGGQVAGAG